MLFPQPRWDACGPYNEADHALQRAYRRSDGLSIESTIWIGFFKNVVQYLRLFLLIQKWSMLGVRLSSYGCTPEVVRARKKR